jgi:hypothetical protein
MISTSPLLPDKPNSACRSVLSHLIRVGKNGACSKPGKSVATPTSWALRQLVERGTFGMAAAGLSTGSVKSRRSR